MKVKRGWLLGAAATATILVGSLAVAGYVTMDDESDDAPIAVNETAGASKDVGVSNDAYRGGWGHGGWGYGRGGYYRGGYDRGYWGSPWGWRRHDARYWW